MTLAGRPPHRRAARVVDGTGAPGRPGRVAVVGDRLALPADDVEVVAARTIDATGLVVAPGFIDLHSHGGLVMLAEPRHEPKVRQGVTTELIGVDGNAYAPVPASRGPRGLRRAQRRPRRPARTSPFDWSTRRRVPRPLRRHDLGQRRLRRRQLAAPDRGHSAGTRSRRTRGRMADQRGDAARGDGGGRVRAVDRPRLPARRVRDDRGAGRAAWARRARLGGFYHTHVRYPLGDGFLDPFREAIEIGRRGGAPVHITHFYHRATFPGTARADARSWSTTPGPRASTSRSTPTPTSGRARAC